MRRGWALFALVLAWPVAAAAAADPGPGSAAARVAAAAAALEAAEAAPAEVAALGKAVADYEAALAVLRAEVDGAAAREQELAQDLGDRRLEISRLLAALEAMSRTPQPTPALHPQGPLAAARAAAMMARLAPAMQAQARDLAGKVEGLREARRVHDAGSADLARTVATLNAARVALATAMAAAAPPPVGPAEPTLTMMARDSASLTALAAALAAAPDAPAPPKAQTEAMVWPVAGEVALPYDERDAAGVRRPGLVLRVPPLALVSAPADAVVRYAGPFLEYGQVVVLEPDAETMVVLAGLTQLQVATGAAVRRGDLLGLMGGRAPEVEEYVMLPDADSGAGDGETLYIEVRQGKGPVDPEPLFAGGNG